MEKLNAVDRRRSMKKLLKVAWYSWKTPGIDMNEPGNFTVKGLHQRRSPNKPDYDKFIIDILAQEKVNRTKVLVLTNKTSSFTTMLCRTILFLKVFDPSF